MKDRIKRTNSKQINHLIKFSMIIFIFLSLIASTITSIMIISCSSTNHNIKVQIHEVDESINSLENKNGDLIRNKK